MNKTTEAEVMETKEDKAAPRPWEQINATVYQLVRLPGGDMVNRFSFNVQGNNRQLKPGEDEEIAALIVRAVNAYDFHVKEIKRLTDERNQLAVAGGDRYAAFEAMRKAIEFALTTPGMVRGRDEMVRALALADKLSKGKP